MKILSTSSSDNNPIKVPVPSVEIVSPHPEPMENSASPSIPADKVAVSIEPAPVAMEELKATLLGELQTLQEKFEQVRLRLTEQLLQNTRQVAKLSDEISDLRDVIVDLKLPEPPEPSRPEPGIIQIQPAGPLEKPTSEGIAPQVSQSETSDQPPLTVLSAGFLDEISRPIKMTENSERKVAFITKLWDYLNQVAFEIPLHKSNRSN